MREEAGLSLLRNKHIYQAIKEEHAEHGYPIDALCKLGKVSRAAYYKWLHRKVPSNEAENERIDRMLAYIEKNYKEDLKLEDLAGEFNFNYHYLSAYFSQQMQEGFSDYLNRVRINKACKLLQESSLPISQISSEVGYAEHSYFCRVFKKITGETPSVWRRNA